ncbi:MAG TPA: hypothetical protein VIR79_06835 [Nitrospira sp.]
MTHQPAVKLSDGQCCRGTEGERKYLLVRGLEAIQYAASYRSFLAGSLADSAGETLKRQRRRLSARGRTAESIGDRQDTTVGASGDDGDRVFVRCLFHRRSLRVQGGYASCDLEKCTFEQILLEEQ